MARTTRSKASASAASTKKSASTATSDNSSSTSRYALPAESTNPPKLFILPTKVSRDAKIVSLLNPRSATPARYLVCPETGTHEFTSIDAPKSTPRSWLIQCSHTDEVCEKTADDGAELGAYITKGANLYVATPIDPIFLLLPALSEPSNNNGAERRLFVASEEYFTYFEKFPEIWPHFNKMLRCGSTLKLLESRMAAVCDTVPVGDEVQFRFNMDKFFSVVLAKARKMSEQPLPKSVEDKFVTKVLEAPVMGMKREAIAAESASQPPQTQASQPESSTPTRASEAFTPKVEPADSQSSASTADTTRSLTSEASTAATSVPEESATQLMPSMQASEEIIKLQRLRTAFDFICARYVAPSHAAALRLKLSGLTTGATATEVAIVEAEEAAAAQVDFGPLDAYLARITQLRQEAAEARAAAGDYSRKRGLDEGERADREERKRRKEEEERRRRAGESRGVRDLRKVNTVGMRKMSDFFKKK
ncbi:ribonuclease H2, subunit B [Durotheca rogersii]|uniref:ribonuclease H2, subunit B n=1 Tax=Durotheca rogersii TaxID=419775 RepID=UPI002220B54C|nr:ribonuclease H2, subunit B [Durotheca rogersii]KAI5866370.1 ribonuclease H2, subunit B [Durotheca rogersii]